MKEGRRQRIFLFDERDESVYGGWSQEILITQVKVMTGRGGNMLGRARPVKKHRSLSLACQKNRS